ncbi:MAG: hypothetical protein HQM01_01025 [Magnetococcales bacterium]|nr:hypothetical protein [Magnetococcales bacterium]
MMRKMGWMVAILGSAWPAPTHTAPLDEFLTANPGFEEMHGEGEVGVDLMNSSVDLFKLRGDPDPRNNAIGDYRGLHARGGLALTRRLWVDGGVWSRKIITPYDNGESLALHAAAQFQVMQPLGVFPAIALRLSGWRDSASEANKGSPTTITQGDLSVTANSIRIDSPRDEQAQIDLIGTWMLPRNTALSTFASFGKSTVSFDQLTINGISVGGETSGGQFVLSPVTMSDGSIGVSGVCVSQCGRVLDFKVPAPAGQTIPNGLNIGYDSTFFQVGGSFSWMSPEWRARLGYRFVKWNRDVDEAVMQLGKNVIDTNHFLTGEIGYKPPFPLFEHAGLFIRGQAMKNQFVGEVPFSYNAFSAHKFDHKYGILTFGISGGF